MRLRTDFWMAAYLRRFNRDGVAAVLRRRGAAESGAVYIKLDCLDGRTAVFGPAPQGGVDDGLDRRFIRLHKEPWVDSAGAEKRLAREIEFDSDIWIVEVESRAGDPLVDLLSV